MGRYYGGFKGSYELYAGSWNKRADRLGGSLHIEIYKSSCKMLWNPEQNFSNFFKMQETLNDFIVFLHQSLDPFLCFQLFVSIQPSRTLCLGGVLSVPRDCPQPAACAHDSPGKPRECSAACRAPRSLDHTWHVSIQAKKLH